MIEEIIGSSYFVCLVFCLCGIIFFGAGKIINLISKRKKSHCTEKTQGTVIDHRLVSESRMGMDRDISNNGYHSIVSFYVNSNTYTVMSNMYGSKALNKKGDIVTVWYNPKDPKQFFIEEEQYIVRRLKNIFTAVGIGVFILGISGAVCIKLNLFNI